MGSLIPERKLEQLVEEIINYMRSDASEIICEGSPKLVLSRKKSERGSYYTIKVGDNEAMKVSSLIELGTLLRKTINGSYTITDIKYW